jgi:hypothetical protein
MHLCFLDESGSAPKPTSNSRQPYFVIAGLIMHEAQWHGIAAEVKAIKAKFKVNGEIKWRYFSPHNNDADNSVRHLSVEQKDEFRWKLFEVITSRKSVRIVACVTSVAAAYKQAYVKSDDDLYEYTYKPVTERFQYYLQDISRVVGDKQLGIVVADHRGKAQDELLRKQHGGLVNQRHMFASKYENYVETVFLTPSHHSVGIQLADLVAGAIGRSFNAPDPRYMDKIRGSFRASPNGQIDGYGLVKFPTKGWV